LEIFDRNIIVEKHKEKQESALVTMNNILFINKKLEYVNILFKNFQFSENRKKMIFHDFEKAKTAEEIKETFKKWSKK
jgi:hypothetical protein